VDSELAWAGADNSQELMQWLGLGQKIAGGSTGWDNAGTELVWLDGT